MRKHLRLLTVALLLSGWSAIVGFASEPRTEAEKRILEICARQPLSSSAVSVFAVRANGDTLACINPALKLVPASNVKLITTGLALKELGPDYRFETRLAYSGSIWDGVLCGDLYIIGGGDPSTGANLSIVQPVDALFAKWARLLREAGIKSIRGRVVADPRCFPETTPENLGWTYDDLGTYYGIGPTGLNFFENAQNFLITPGESEGSHPRISPRYPLTPWMDFDNKAVTGPARSANSVYLINTPLAPKAMFAGSFPIDRKGYTYEGSNRYAAFTCADYFCNYLGNNGLKVSEGPADVSSEGFLRRLPDLQESSERAEAAESLTVVGSTYSPTLFDLVCQTNCESDNFFAETLLKALSLSKGSATDYDSSVAVALKCLESLGLRTSGRCQLFDGSGLSRKNYISSSFFVEFLRAMLRQDCAELYMRSLPVPGGKGTLEYKFPQESPGFRARIRMKSGSMNGVRCYSGYILSPDGDPARTIVFSLLTNNVTADSWMVNPSIDGIIKALASEN